MREDEELAALRRRALVSTTIGNALEWFDFAVFGLFAGAIGALFFPTGHGTNALLLAFATFGVAFVARPLGGVVFGLVADRHGRKTALVWMIALMAFGTGLIAILPTYAAIGIAAPALLVLARVIQGFSAGGEFGGASALLIEFAPPGRRGYFGAFQMMSQALAYALGAAIALALARALTPEAFAAWGWRVPFAVGLLIGPVGVYLRRACAESPEFVAYRAAHAPAARPLAQLVSGHGREIAASFGVIAAGAAMNYVGVVFVPVYATTQFGLPALEAGAETARNAAYQADRANLAALLDEFGGRFELPSRYLTLGFEPSIMFGVNSYRATLNTANIGSGLDAPVSIRQVETTFGPLADMKTYARAQFSEHLSLYVAYNLMWAGMITRAPNNIVYNVTGNAIPRPGAFQQDVKFSDLLIQGVSVGGEVSW